MNSEDILYSTGNSTQYLVIIYKGEGSEKDYTYICIYMHIYTHMYVCIIQHVYISVCITESLCTHETNTL